MNKQQKINGVISDQLGVNADSIRRDQNLMNDLGAVSLDSVELVMALEEEFEVEIPDAECEAWGTVADVYKYFDCDD